MSKYNSGWSPKGYDYWGGYYDNFKSGWGGKSWWKSYEPLKRKKEQARFHEGGALPDEVQSMVEGEMLGTTGTAYAGYDMISMAEDINGNFRGTKRRHLKEVAKEGFEENALYGFQVGKESRLPSEARKDAVNYFKFFSRFSRSDLKQMLLAQAGGDADVATRLFFEQGGGSGDPQDLEELARMTKKELAQYGIGSGREDGGMGKYLDIKQILRHIRKDWDFAGERGRLIRETPYPADDLDFRPMKSVAEVAKATADAFGDMRLLGWKLATRAVTVRRHWEYVPGPPKRFVVLIDHSGSMSEGVPVKINGKQFPAWAWATAIAIAVCQAAEAADNKVTVALFEYGVSAHMEGTSKEAEAWLWKVGWRGGGTDINAAVEFANAKGAEVEAVICITDGYDNSNVHCDSTLYPVFTGHKEPPSCNGMRTLIEGAKRVTWLADALSEEKAK